MVAQLLQELKEVKCATESILQKQNKELSEKLLSPSEACKLFQPSISKVTLDSWARKGLIKKHAIGGRVYFKYTEVMEALKSLKKYKH
ncbi:MAG: helix-turn-helix domain-containing protein [Bacteroidetes bacterium]|nr:helix-turn-helix domain-containing protein [Bacteroidota bacterium]